MTTKTLTLSIEKLCARLGKNAKCQVCKARTEFSIYRGNNGVVCLMRDCTCQTFEILSLGDPFPLDGGKCSRCKIRKEMHDGGRGGWHKNTIYVEGEGAPTPDTLIYKKVACPNCGYYNTENSIRMLHGVYFLWCNKCNKETPKKEWFAIVKRACKKFKPPLATVSGLRILEGNCECGHEDANHRSDGQCTIMTRTGKNQCKCKQFKPVQKVEVMVRI